MDLLIRFAKMEDAEELLALYTPYVTDTVITFEYEVPSLEEFKDRMRQTMKKYPYLVAEQNGEILGYSCAGAFKGRAAYDWAVEIPASARAPCARCASTWRRTGSCPRRSKRGARRRRSPARHP